MGTAVTRTVARCKNVTDQLGWMEHEHIIHHWSPPGAGQPKWAITLREHGPRMELTMTEVEAFISGGMTVWSFGLRGFKRTPVLGEPQAGERSNTP